MGLNGLGLRLKRVYICTKSCIRRNIGLLCFSYPIGLALLSLVLVCSSEKDWIFRPGILDHMPFLAIYNLLVLSFLIFLGFRIRSLGRRCREFGEKLSACGELCPRNQSCNEEEEGFDEKEEDDVVRLREEIGKERRLRAAAELELEKERRAASSAADEAMNKIMSLQSEKAMVEREARQYRQMAEKNQHYDGEVIEHLKWIILKLEAESKCKCVERQL